MSYAIFTAGKLQELAASATVSKLYRSGSERFWVNLVSKDRPESLISEMHDHEADIYLVIEGEADLYLGGTLENPTSPGPGQHLGTGLQGATVHPLRPGDLIVIPEGVPHMVDVRSARLVYTVIKEDVSPDV